MLALGQSTPAPYGDIQAQTARTRGNEIGNETALLQLADLKRKQASEEEVMAAIQKNPELAKLIFGEGPVLGSLGPAGGMPAPGGMPPPGPITQSPLGGGPAQQIPASPDLSRFAGVSPQGGGPLPAGVGMPTVTPPQSTIASLGPAGPPQPQATQNPVLALAAKDPRAAMMLQQQMQTQEDRKWKMQEQQLDMGTKVAAGVARELNSVRDQATLDAARERIRQYHPQAAAQIPQFYSKEALEPLIMKGVAVEKLAEWRKNMATAQHTELMTQQLPKVFGALERFATGAGAGTQEPQAGQQATPPPAQQGGQPPRTAAKPPPESDVTRAIRAEVVRQGGDQALADLAVAVATQESYLKPDAVGDGGQGLGLFQLHKGAAIDARIDPAKRADPTLNIQGGVTYLKQKLAQSGGDVDKALKLYNGGGDPNYVANVRRFLPGGQSPATTGGTSTAQAPPTNPRIAQLDTQITQGNQAALAAESAGLEGPARQVRAQVEQLTKERDRLFDQARHQQERGEETPRAVEKETALQPLKLAQQRAAAEVSLEAKMNEPIGPENALNMNLPPQTRWKDVPKDVKITKQLGDTTAKQFSEFKASHAGLGRVLGMLDNPAAKSIIGTLFSGDNAAFRRRAGEWISSVTPQERKFVASLVSEIADIRHTLSGAAVSAPEAEFLQPMMPSAADPDVATVRAKLEALQEWVTRKHDAYRDQFAQSGYRVPAAMERTVEKAPPAGSGNVDKFKAIKP